MKYIESITLYQRVCSAQREYVWKWIAEYVNWKAKPWGGNFFRVKQAHARTMMPQKD